MKVLANGPVNMTFDVPTTLPKIDKIAVVLKAMPADCPSMVTYRQLGQQVGPGRLHPYRILFDGSAADLSITSAQGFVIMNQVVTALRQIDEKQSFRVNRSYFGQNDDNKILPSKIQLHEKINKVKHSYFHKNDELNMQSIASLFTLSLLSATPLANAAENGLIAYPKTAVGNVPPCRSAVYHSYGTPQRAFPTG